MAKGNLILGTASKKLGDVIMYRKDGVQMSRAYVSKISNPKSDGQSAQRLKLNPAQKFYSAFNGVLDHSFQSVKYGAKSYSHFLKMAMKQNNGPYVPKGFEGVVPAPFVVSQGSLQEFRTTRPTTEAGKNGASNGYAVVQTNIHASGNYSEDVPTWGSLSTGIIQASNGALLDGDQITILAIWCRGTLVDGEWQVDTDNYSAIPTTNRIVLNTFSQDLINNFDFKPLVDFRGNGVVSFAPTGVSDTSNYAIMGSAVIISRKEDNVWKRSFSKMQIDPALNNIFFSSDAAGAAIQSYGQQQENTYESKRYLNNAGVDDLTNVGTFDISSIILNGAETPIVGWAKSHKKPDNTDLSKIGYEPLPMQVLTGYNTQTDKTYLVCFSGTKKYCAMNYGNFVQGNNGKAATYIYAATGDKSAVTWQRVSADMIPQVVSGEWGVNQTYVKTVLNNEDSEEPSKNGLGV